SACRGPCTVCRLLSTVYGMLSMATQLARRYLISGRVQGVGYRYFAEREAHRLGVGGYVKNLAGGDVEVYAVGPLAVLAEFKRRLAAGPRSARVAALKESEAAIERGYSTFAIEGGW
ncbi:MAG: acylphosphatase, partial [Pseudomonadota bacterium]